VRIKEPFALGKYAVTFDEFDEFVLAAGYPYQPAAPYGRGRMPVMNVSWKEA
jgi:formylglycine-generating enzyme required for sulfatase activity